MGATRSRASNRRRFGKIQEEPNWEEIFWRVNRYWGGFDQRFSASNFGFQPIWLILQALHYGAKLHAEELHLAELGIATLTSCFVNANRDPKKGKPASPKDFFYFAPQDKTSEVKISATAANVFFWLIQQELMPDWVVAIAPLDKLREVRNGKPTSEISYLIGDGILLINTKINDDSVEFSLGFINGCSGLIEARDNAVNKLILSVESHPPMWILDGEIGIAEGWYS